MIARKGFLFTDPFSFTPVQYEWIDLHWGFHIMAYGIYALFDLSGLVITKSLVIGIIAFFIATIVHKPLYSLVSVFAYAILVYDARYLILIRPILITLFCIVYYIWSFERYFKSKNSLYLWTLLPVQLLWVNSQGLFPLGVVVAGCYCADMMVRRCLFKNTYNEQNREIGKMVLFCIILMIISFCNPYGVNGALLPLRLLGRINPVSSNIFARNISENVPLFELTGIDLRYQYTVFVITLLVIVSFVVNVKNIRWVFLFLFISFLLLAVMAKRNIVLYYVVACPILGYNFSSDTFINLVRCTLPKHICRLAGGVMFFLLILVVVLYAKNHWAVVQNYPAQSSISPFRVPHGAVDYLKQHPIQGNVFNSVRYGGYLLWHFYPDKRVYIDGRLIIRSAEFFQHYLDILKNPHSFTAIAQKHSITHAVLPVSVFALYRNLIAWLYKSREWDMVYTDGEAVVFMKKGKHRYTALDVQKKESVDIIQDCIIQRWNNNRYIQDEALWYNSQLVQLLRQQGQE